jgi:hypothetical protein
MPGELKFSQFQRLSAVTPAMLQWDPCVIWHDESSATSREWLVLCLLNMNVSVFVFR